MAFNGVNFTSVNGAIPILDTRKEKNKWIEPGPTLGSWILLFLYAGLQLYLEETPARVFSCVYCKIFKSIYYEEYLGTTSKILRWFFFKHIFVLFCFVLGFFGFFDENLRE